MPLAESLDLNRGTVGRYLADRLGHGQFVGIQIPGNYLDITAYALPWRDHEIVTTSKIEIAATSHVCLDWLRDARPELVTSQMVV